MNKFLTCLFLIQALCQSGFAQLTRNTSTIGIGQVDSRTTQIRIPILNQSREKIHFSMYNGSNQALVSIPKSIDSYDQEFISVTPASFSSGKHFKLKLIFESKDGQTDVHIKGKRAGSRGNQDCYDFEKDHSKNRSNVKSARQSIQTKTLRLYNKKNKTQLYCADPEKVPYAHIVVLVDASGSMGGKDKLNQIKEQLKALVNEMRPTDYISVLRYADGAELVLDKISCMENELINNTIDNIEAGGFTNGKEGIESAMEQSRLQQKAAYSNHVIMFTDGNFNLGEDQEGIRRYLLGQSSVMSYKLSVLTIGSDTENDKEMKELTKAGGGYFFNLDGENVLPETLNKILIKQLSA